MFFVSNNVCNSWRYVLHKTSRQINKKQGQKYHIENYPKWWFDWYQDSPVQDFQCSSPVLSHPSMCPNFYQMKFTESKNWKIRLSNLIICKNLCWPKIEVHFQFSRVVDGVAVLSIHNNTSEYSECGFHYTIHKSNGVYSTQPRR